MPDQADDRARVQGQSHAERAGLYAARPHADPASEDRARQSLAQKLRDLLAEHPAIPMVAG
jgi:hypothetical protein